MADCTGAPSQLEPPAEWPRGGVWPSSVFSPDDLISLGHHCLLCIFMSTRLGAHGKQLLDKAAWQLVTVSDKNTWDPSLTPGTKTNLCPPKNSESQARTLILQMKTVQWIEPAQV